MCGSIVFKTKKKTSKVSLEEEREKGRFLGAHLEVSHVIVTHIPMARTYMAGLNYKEEEN